MRDHPQLTLYPRVPFVSAGYSGGNWAIFAGYNIPGAGEQSNEIPPNSLYLKNLKNS